MGKRLYLPSTVTINGHEVACDVEELEILTGKRPTREVTGQCDTFEQHLTPYMRKWGVRLNGFINYDASSSSATGISLVLKGIYDSTATTGVTFVCRHTTGARGVDNHEWSGLVGLESDFSPHGGKIAEEEKFSVTLKGMGNLTWYTCSS